MGDLFSGLESMGLGGLSNIRIYDEEKQDSQKGGTEAAKHVVTEEDFLFDQMDLLQQAAGRQQSFILITEGIKPIGRATVQDDVLEFIK